MASIDLSASQALLEEIASLEEGGTGSLPPELAKLKEAILASMPPPERQRTPARRIALELQGYTLSPSYREGARVSELDESATTFVAFQVSLPGDGNFRITVQRLGDGED